MATKKIKVFHCITSMHGDGAQRMLLRVVSGLESEQFQSVIINLRGQGPLVREFEVRGFTVHSLGLGRDIKLAKFLGILNILRKEEPDIIQGWMEHGNLFASFLSKICTNKPVVLWNIRRSLDSLRNDKWLTKLVIRLNVFLSRFPRRIVFCAANSVQQYQSIGLSVKNSAVIPNGFEVEKFFPRTGAADELRKILNLSSSSRTIGFVARYHPQKDHINLIRAFSLLKERFPEAHLVLIGGDINTDNISLVAALKEFGVVHRTHLMGIREDIAELYSGLDVFCLPSRSEGFPNVVGEAMASGVPCVVTDCGEARNIVEGIGKVVPPENSEALAEALAHMLALSDIEKREIGQRSRERVLKRYAMPKVVEQYSNMYKQFGTDSFLDGVLAY